ncbi:uncharacterized protein LOC110464676 isoform X2 [Mizuhopecten yessoensis]|uniref:CARD domain-containing protein n=2 Tax=Mizuhopecten yessoensis TaxID=6573 RepID=A0A210PTB4_MIZYE|nr:uncharacterized protein LOC110464676 isoform X2 [Mizuhopecten yessoensis]OWF39740.1 hypothetical protein KP79_PYT05826 [Mizuhopecten yessoensis]
MDYSKDQIKFILCDLNNLSAAELERLGTELAAMKIQSAVNQMEKILGCASTRDHISRPAYLPAAKRKRHTPVVPTHSQDNCSDGSTYNLQVKPCDRESPCQQEEPYQTVLRENHLHLMNDLQLDSTQLLDQLLEEEVMCTADVESLRRIRNRRKKTRTLLTQLAVYGPKKFEKFKQALRLSHSHLFEKLVKTESKDKSMFTTRECLACKIARDVDIGDVVDRLYSSGVLLREDVQYVLQRQSCRESWIVIFKCTKDAKSNGLSVLWECLKSKYPELAEAVRTETEYIKCNCRKAMRSEKDNKQQSLLPISRTASGPYNVIDNPYMSMPRDLSALTDTSEHTYEKCVDGSECLEAPIYCNVRDIGIDFKEPLYENDTLKDQCEVNESSNSKDKNGNEERYTRSLSWDNAMYYNCVESISGEEDPTYLHPCEVDSMSCLNGDRNGEQDSGSRRSDESTESVIVRRGAVRRRYGRESK